MVKFTLPLAFVLAFALAGPAAAQEWKGYDDRWYVTPGIGMVRLDSDRNTDTTDIFYSIGIGRFLHPRFSLDLQHDRYITDLDSGIAPPGASERFNLFSTGLFGRFYFTEEKIRPFGVFGLGLQEHRNFVDSGRDGFVSLGGGVHARLNDYVDFRAQIEARYDDDRSTVDSSWGFVDFIGHVGLSIKFGAPPRPPAPTPEPRPAEPAPRPAPPPAPAPEREVLVELDAAVAFEFDSANLRPEARAELNEAAALLKMHPEIRRVEVAGHTCDIGPAAYNQGLSERRALSVRNYLVEQGVEPGRLSPRGYGETRPKLPNISEENRSRNRRVELVVLERDHRP